MYQKKKKKLIEKSKHVKKIVCFLLFIGLFFLLLFILGIIIAIIDFAVWIMIPTFFCFLAFIAFIIIGSSYHNTFYENEYIPLLIELLGMKVNSELKPVNKREIIDELKDTKYLQKYDRPTGMIYKDANNYYINGRLIRSSGNSSHKVFDGFMAFEIASNKRYYATNSFSTIFGLKKIGKMDKVRYYSYGNDEEIPPFLKRIYETTDILNSSTCTVILFDKWCIISYTYSSLNKIKYHLSIDDEKIKKDLENAYEFYKNAKELEEKIREIEQNVY